MPDQLRTLRVVLWCAGLATTAAFGHGGSEPPAAWIDDLSPLPAEEWNHARAGHLIERAGFGATPEEIRVLAELSPEEAVDRIVEYASVDGSGLADFEESGIWDPGMDPFPPSRAESVRIARERGISLGVKALPEGASRRLQPVVDKFFYGLRSNVLETKRLALWWANRMVTTPRPLEEKMTLFWHGHFATSEGKVRDYRLMLAQNRMLRRLATGSFRNLLLGIMRDPAMLVYLDNGQNVKDHPNENFGRELLELFTMGVGNYTERDIREASRAFTGWTNDVTSFRFDSSLHDDRPKEFLGRKGRFGGEGIIDIILEQPATAEFIASKIYRFFVRADISVPMREALGKLLAKSGYEIRPLLKTIFLSRDFYSSLSVGTQIKSPVQLVVSTYRKLGVSRAPTVPDFNQLTGRLGQSLLYPPNVAGWEGGRTWITPASLLDRGNLLRSVLFPPPLTEFGQPDRRLPAIYRRVEERLGRGMNITNATRSGDSGSSMLADADEDYNTRYGGYRGYVMAYERVRLVHRHTVGVSLGALVERAGATEPEAAVDHLMERFLRVDLGAADRAHLVDFLKDRIGSDTLGGQSARIEEALRSLLYVILSSPEYQLG